MYYTKNAKDTHPELMENTLGCYSKQTAAIQKDTFQSIIKDSFGADEQKADKIFMEVQDNLNNIIDEYNAIYDDPDSEPITLTNTDIQSLLIESGIPEELTSKIEKSYIECFGDDLPLAENLIDTKVLKANEQRKREERLEKQVEILQNRLEQVKQEVAIDKESAPLLDNNDDPTLDNSVESNLDESIDHNLEELKDNDLEEAIEAVVEEAQENIQSNDKADSEYDVILHVKPEKIPQIKSQMIDGQKCIVIPINENEQTTVNGLDDLI